MDEPPIRLITSHEAAEILGTSDQYVRKLITKGVLEAGKIGKEWILFEHHVEHHKRNLPKRGRPPKVKRPYVKRNLEYWGSVTVDHPNGDLGT